MSITLVVIRHRKRWGYIGSKQFGKVKIQKFLKTQPSNEHSYMKDIEEIYVSRGHFVNSRIRIVSYI